MSFDPSSITRYIAALRKRGDTAGRYGEARTRKMEEQARKATLDRMARQGELVAIADLGQAIEGSYQAMRRRLLAIPTRFAPRLGNDVRRNSQLLTDAIDEALAEIAKISFVSNETEAA